MDIKIIVPFEGAERYTPIWAYEEAEIDFRHDPARAARCTSAFAAVELKSYLERTLRDARVSFASRRGSDGNSAEQFVELRIAEDGSKHDGFALAPDGDGVVITGYSRAGLLYGAYELLRLQGWRWYAPGKLGEVAPAQTDQLVRPHQKGQHSPSFSLGRGFDFEYPSMESAELLLWMARNRLNVCGLRPASVAMARKLDMHPKIGGHIFEAMLAPERPMPSGRTLWEDHPEWYGLPATGTRSKETALATQFCVSQPDLIAFLGAEFLHLLSGRWHDADRIDVWGFDTWGNTCACPHCTALGNSADQVLFFLARLRDFLNQARRDGQLDHDVQLATCAYEGTATLAGPRHPIPHNLIEAGDHIAFYPINRCYAHDLADPHCRINSAYSAAMASWLAHAPALSFIAAEYYNVSKYEDLPLLFNTRIGDDLRAYHQRGAVGITYMHLPMVNWAMRTLTQALYAQLAWDATTDTTAFVAEYFTNWYGPYAGEMRRAYDLIETAWQYIADWRAWAPGSILSQLLAWDGRRPAQPLRATNHFATPAEAIANGERSLARLHEAMTIVDACHHTEKQAGAASLDGTAHLAAAANPVQARALEQHRHHEWRLGEDRRLLRYGIDVLALMTALVTYHEALRTGDAATAEAAYQAGEHTAEALDAYYVPIGYEWPGPGLESKDGLTRSQLKDVLRRIRLAQTPGAQTPGVSETPGV
ncbi:MAG: DUF4838 domain-containing protein [Chloroflexi bacterium]|nr:DUF4838 domain-containing protein [Chloroflexota bacterium]